MTPAEKDAMIKFFGTMHAQGKQTDQMVVNSSHHLNPISKTIQSELTNILSQQHQPVRYQPVIQQPVEAVAPVELETAVRELRELGEMPSSFAQQTMIPIKEDGLVEELKKINLNLQKIVTTLEKLNGKPKKIINKKQI
jgi:hypothetical protein